MTTLDDRIRRARAGFSADPDPSLPGASATPRAGRHAAPPQYGPERSSFRPDIEGLRAVAILTVVAYHAGVGFMPGGFVGVDVFFVISGFLITGLIVREMRTTGTVSVAGFYARRAKRLLPATAVVLSVVALLSAVIVSSVDRGDVGLDIAAAATYVANWRFGFDAVDYFATGTPSPVLHFWSLAVEEQFYLVWPWLLLLVTRGARRRGTSMTGPLVMGLVVVAVPSLWWSIAQTESAPGWAYISSFTRAWELAIGGGVAMLVPLLARTPRMVAALLGWAGALAIAWSVLTYSESLPYPGNAALVPVLGTAALIVAGTRLPDAGASRLLSTDLMTHFGGLSYSWYLWHWPLLVLAAIVVGGELTWWMALPLVVLSYSLASLSKTFVEEPFHHSRALSQHPGRALRLGAVCTAIGLVAGVALWVPAALAERNAPDPSTAPGAAAILPEVTVVDGADDVPTKPSASASAPAAVVDTGPITEYVPALSKIREDHVRTYDDGCHQKYPETAVPTCTYGDLNADRTVVLFGDSHAATWFPAVDKMAQKEGWRLVNLTKHACPVADAKVYAVQLERGYRECDEWRASALGRIAAEKPDLVLLTNRTDYLVMKGGEALDRDASAPLMQAAMTRMYKRLDTLAGTVVVLRDNPIYGADAVECLARAEDDARKCTKPISGTYPQPDTQGPAAAAAKVDFVDTWPLFCPQDICPVVIGGVVLWRDDQHMTATYSRTLTPWITKVVAAVAP